jgi:hypothetical protein
MIVVAVLVTSSVASFFYVELQPSIVVKGFGASWVQSNGCSSGTYWITNWNWSANLVNNGGGGFADLGYYIDGLQVASGSYYVPAHSQTSVNGRLGISGCYHVSSSLPDYKVVVLSQRPGWATWNFS